ncbi:MAG: hypothetical protein JRD89_01500 [Deltaproteobacteria bacterium]|nr:hypothetical protein [Deltaproteobacteria bacterium]
MPQLSVNENAPIAVSGMASDNAGLECISRVSATRQKEQVVVTTEYNSEIFTITIDGTAYPYTSDGSATKAEISAGLKALIDAGSATVEVVDDLTDTLTIESTDHDNGFTISITNPANGVLTLTALVAQEEALGFGKFVVNDTGVDIDAAGQVGVRLPIATGEVTGAPAGFVRADMSRQTRETAPYAGYNSGNMVPVARKGRMWVEVESGQVGSVAAFASVFARFVAAGTEELGAIRTDADTSDAVAIPGCKFTGRKIAAENIAEVEMDFVG